MLEYDRIQANISCFPRRLQDVLKTSSAWHFSSSKTSWRHLVGIFTIRLPKMSSRRLQNVFKTSSRRVCKTSCNYVFKTSWKTKNVTLKTSWRRLEDVFSTFSPRRMFAGMDVLDLMKKLMLAKPVIKVKP